MDLKAIGARITRERERAGLSQRELAARADLSQSTLNRMELGTRATASVAELDRIARALELPLRALTRDSPVHDRMQVAARAAMGAEADRERAARTAGDILALDDRLDALGIASATSPLPADRLPPLPPVALSPEQQGQQLADAVRRSFGLGGNPIPDLAEFAELSLGLDTATLALPRAVSGFTALDPVRHVTLVVVNTHDVRERQRFTLAHEIAHTLFGDGVQAHHLTSARTPAEERSDAFARHLLAPTDGIRRQLGPGADDAAEPLGLRVCALLARHFGISPTAMLVQLKRMGLISTQEQQEFTGLSGRQLAWRFGWGPQYDDEAAAAQQVRAPRRILERAVNAYREGRIGVRAVAALDGADPRETEAALRAAGITPAEPPPARRMNLQALLARRREAPAGPGGVAAEGDGTDRR
ncbi:helix-turn-helix domain-containing protein [Streptomyces sp. NPDC092296]|uniref:helix-turn-helix domain-containing protein n=1 Tax=Streptomyces sp. NPDC092296 TaxID=3366012 RepID=UPI0038305E58